MVMRYPHLILYADFKAINYYPTYTFSKTYIFLAKNK